MKIFLLGHSGFIGSHISLRLKALNFDVVTDLRYWEDRYDFIINLAAVTHTRNEFDPKMIESNIILAKKVFQRSEKIIQASSCSAAHFTNPYSLTKLWAEYLSKQHGNSICLRLFNCYGKNNNKGIVWFLMQQENGSKITIRGDQLVRDYVYIDDVVDEIIRSIEYDPGVYDVGTGVGTETMSLVNIYQELSGKRFDISVSEAGSNEPLSMISNRIVGNISLREGLQKMIDDEGANKM